MRAHPDPYKISYEANKSTVLQAKLSIIMNSTVGYFAHCPNEISSIEFKILSQLLQEELWFFTYKPSKQVIS